MRWLREVIIETDVQYYINSDSPHPVIHRSNYDATMIHVLGSINIDYAVTLSQLPAPGETLTGHNLVLTPGGKGANQALAACRALSLIHI